MSCKVRVSKDRMKQKKQKHRFKEKFSQIEHDGTGFKTIEDTETGVMYLYVYGPGHGGLTVLRDEEGNPLIEPEA